MDIAAFVVSVLALIVAGIMAWHAHDANQKADTANKHATEALDLQRRIDDREREFRMVAWHGGFYTPPDADAWFELRNIGWTDAIDVVLVLELPTGSIVRRSFPIIASDTKVIVPLGGIPSWVREERQFGEDASFLVHWSSPLGQADRYSHTDGHETYRSGGMNSAG